MRDADAVRTAETKARYLIEGVSPDQQRELAVLAITMVITQRDTMSPNARRVLDDTMSVVAPDLLLTLRATHELARHATRSRRNWRTRS